MYISVCQLPSVFNYEINWPNYNQNHIYIVQFGWNNTLYALVHYNSSYLHSLQLGEK